MLSNTLRTLFKRDLERLKNEMQQYSSETIIWKVDKNITNCGGNLCLHLIGNLNTFIGAILGNTGYIRQRELEFSLKDVPLTVMIQQINDVTQIIDTTLDGITDEALKKDYPDLPGRDKMTIEFFLIYLSMHLSYHLGQINYHRRMLDT